jgi:hypothetical protein
MGSGALTLNKMREFVIVFGKVVFWVVKKSLNFSIRVSIELNSIILTAFK